MAKRIGNFGQGRIRQTFSREGGKLPNRREKPKEIRPGKIDPNMGQGKFGLRKIGPHR